MIQAQHLEDFIKSVEFLKAQAIENCKSEDCESAIAKVDSFLAALGYKSDLEGSTDHGSTETQQAQPVVDKYSTLGKDESIWFKLSVLLNTDNPMRVLARLSEKYGGCIPVNLKTGKVFFLSEPQHFRHVLVSNEDKYIKYFEGLKPIFGNSMITIDGALWQKIRKPQQPAFHPNMYADYIPYFRSAVETRIKAWDEISETGQTIDLLEETWALAAEMVTKALFDREVPFNPHIVFNAVKSYTDVQNHKSLRLRQVAGSLEEIGEEPPAKAIDAWLELAPIVFGAEPREHRTNTLLNMMQRAEEDDSIPEFDRQQTIDEMKQYLWAGTETTALTTAWAIYMMTVHPDMKEKVRAEAKSIFDNNDTVDLDQIRNLAFTKSVIQETLRHFPPIWSLIRTAKETDHINGHRIRPGDNVVLSTYVSHHNPKYWKNPDEFNPGRFASPQAIKAQVKYSYLPFGLGKRSCIGGAMAILEATLALAELLHHFEPEYVGTKPAVPEASVTLVPKGGLPFRMHKR